MNTVQLYPQTPKHSKWLKNTLSMFYNLRLFLGFLAINFYVNCVAIVIFPVFLQQNTFQQVYVVSLKVLTKAYKTRDNGLPHFLPAKQWFGNALPKAMKTCFKAILLIITHKVGGICYSSQRKLIAPNLTATCNSLSLRKSMRWLSGSNVMIVGPILLTSQKLKSSSWKNGAWPIGYFPIARPISVLVAFDHYRYNKTN